MVRDRVTRPIRRKTKGSRTLAGLARDIAVRSAVPVRKRRPSEPKATRRLSRGRLRSLPPLSRADIQRLFRAALIRACGGDARASARGVLWRDGSDEVIVYAARAIVSMGPALLVTSIPVYTDESGDAQVVVPFVTNPAESPWGLIAATETKPRGPAAVIDVFGDALVAVAWAALVEAAAAWAGAAGNAAGNGRLTPAGLSATKEGLLVIGQRPVDPEGR